MKLLENVKLNLVMIFFEWNLKAGLNTENKILMQVLKTDAKSPQLLQVYQFSFIYDIKMCFLLLS